MHLVCKDQTEKVDVYEYFGVGVRAKGVDYELAEWVQFYGVRWLGHTMRMNEHVFSQCMRAGLKERV